MVFSSVKLYLFTGTGNTFLIARHIAEVLQSNGKTVSLHRMEKSPPGRLEHEEELLGLAFPVACGASYPSAIRFLEELPDGHGREVFMFVTFGHFSAGLQGPVGKLLLKKGYRLKGAEAFKMPDNFPSHPLSEIERAALLKSALEGATLFAADLLAERAEWKKGIPLLSDWLYGFGKTARPWNAVKKKIPIHLNKPACIRCGRCYRLCPNKSITIPDYPSIDAETCEICLRCLRFCPTRALTISRPQAEPGNGLSYDDFMRAFRKSR